MTPRVPRMSKEELRERSGEIVILDVRSEKDWNGSELKIRGAERAAPHEEARWSEQYPKDGVYLLYCA